MATSTEIKTAIDTDITNKTLPGSATHQNVGARMKDIVDYTDQEINTLSNSLSAVALSNDYNDLDNLPVLPYKKLVGIITQSGTSTPVITIFENTFTGGSVTTARFNNGAYGIYLPGTNDFTKLYCIIGDDSNSQDSRLTMYKASDGVNLIVGIGSYTVSTNTATDDKLNSTPFEIRIYN